MVYLFIYCSHQPVVRVARAGEWKGACKEALGVHSCMQGAEKVRLLPEEADRQFQFLGSPSSHLH